MRYALALVCPPLALLASHRPRQATVAAILFGVAIVTLALWVGAFLDILLILWAINAVGDESAAREAQAFIATVKPIPVIHG